MSYLLTLYQKPGFFWSCLWNWFLRKRVEEQKIDPERIDEYRGISPIPRPAGSLLWIHGVSVGESVSGLPLIFALRKVYPEMHILLTTTTQTSGIVVAENLPEGVFHQYLPVDHCQWVERFFDFWSPDVGIWLESEVWPNLCWVADQKGIPRVMLNGRVSKKSQNRWSWCPGITRALMGGFSLIRVQNIHSLGFFHSLGATHAKIGADLKNAAPPLDADSNLLALWQKRVQNRSFWLAASTHRGEETMLCAAHEILRQNYPDLLCILVPRHPDRGEAVQQALQQQSHLCVTLGSKQNYSEQTDIFVADAMGQLGMFYRLAPFAFVGGSLVNCGGHNMREAFLLSCLPIVGPHLENFVTQKTYFEDFIVSVENVESLARAVKAKLAAPQSVERRAEQARELAIKMKEGVIEEILQDLAPLLENMRS